MADFVPDAEIRLLVRRAQDGDDEAFAELYAQFFPSIYRYSAFRLPAAAAEDVTADVFVKAWEKLHTYKAHKDVPFAAWLFRIARHTVIDVYRRDRSFEEVPETLADTDALNRPELRAERGELLRVVRGALDRMPRRYREILTLAYMGDLSHEEIARVLRLSAGAVRILKLRALRKLEAELPPDVADYRRNE
jgi:RNA polymerase sigma-70 factor (ECF subfamily)